MRKIGTLPTDQDATRLSGVLYLRGIENDVEVEDDGTFAIWVHDDHLVETGRKVLAEYLANPRAGQFTKAPTEAERARARAAKQDQARGQNVMTRERMEYERNFHAFASLPIVLMVACIAVAVQADLVFSSVPKNTPEGMAWLKWLFISMDLKAMDRSQLHGLGELTEVWQGQVWRLVTPMFIHFGALHLVFNMMWLRDLGSFIQNRFGAWYLTMMVLLGSLATNVAQFCWNGSMFGGMSGVNYALFGFLWMRGKHDRFAVWTLNPMIVQTMLIWFFACAVGLLGPVANAGHAGGLIFGAAWGYLSAKIVSRRRGG
jgi:GlpG protein